MERNPKRWERLVKLLGSSSAREVLARTPWIWRGTRCLFVLSTGRTGTDTLRHLLALSPQIDAYHEPRPQLMVERKRARWEVNQAVQQYEQIIRRARGPALLWARLRGRVYAETSARLTFFAPVLAGLLPNARFVFIHRHPAEIVRSGMRRGWYEGHAADFARITPVPGEAPYDAWADMDAFHKIAWYWEAYNRFALEARAQIGEDRVLTLRANELFDGSGVTAIFRHLQVPVPPRAAIDAVLSKKHNAQITTSYPTQDAWTPAMWAELHRVAGSTMEALGYAVDVP